MTPDKRDACAAEARGEKAFSIIDYAVKVVVVTLVVMGLMILIVELSGVGMAGANEHKILRYRMVAAPVLIIGYLLIDLLLARRRTSRAAETLARDEAAQRPNAFSLSIDSEADRRAAAAVAARDAKPVQARRGYAIEFMALVFVAGGGVAFWQDRIDHDIPNAKAVPATFVSAQCVAQTTRRIGGTVGPHMSILYEYLSQSTRPRDSGMKCLLENCEPETKPRQYTDTEQQRVFYASLALCQAALPAVLAAKAPTTVWTGDKDTNASIRARFTPEREKPPYFLLWFPGAVAAVILLISGFARRGGRR